MEIVPAIDLRHGACVRLYQGDYSREEVFDTDPVAVAGRWRDAGAHMLHVVDLDGAAAGEVVNRDAIAAILATPGVSVEVGGGIRTFADADWLVSNGAARVILGTVAVEEPDLVRRLVGAFGGAVVVSLDARDGRMATRGWLVDTQVDVSELCRAMREAGVSRFIYTDVKRDGTLTAPNFEAIGRLVRSTDAPVAAAGGITTLEDIARLRDVGAAGAILGKSIYTGSIDLRMAIELYGG
jgi:phosphoribosylformimino-5-aminoimidazole carboxamide ribotide isomerase